MSALPVALSAIIIVFAWFTVGVFVTSLLIRFKWLGRTEVEDEFFLGVLTIIWPLVLLIAAVGATFHYFAKLAKFLAKKIGGEK